MAHQDPSPVARAESSARDGQVHRPSADLPHWGWPPVLVIILALMVLAYAPALEFRYYADDYPLIARPGVLLDRLGWAGYLRGLFGPPPEHWGATFYRPLWEGSFILDAALGARPDRSHWINLAIHGAAAITAGFLARGVRLSRSASLLVVALFALSPTSHEVVGWIAARSTSLVDFFLIGSLAAWLRSSGRDRWSRLSLAMLFAAFLSKDSALLYPALLIPALIARDRPTTLRGLGSVFRCARAPLILFAALFAARWFLIGEPIGGYDDDRRALGSPQEFVQAIARLTAGWSWPFAEWAPRRLPQFAGGALFVASIFGVLMFGARQPAGATRPRTPRVPVAVWLGFALCLTAFLPTLGYEQHGLDSASTRYFHLPAIGWALVVGATIERLVAHGPRPLWAIGTIGLVVCGGQFIALRAHLRSYLPGDRLVGEVLAQAEHWATQLEGPVVLTGAPAQIGPVPVLGETLPHALAPPFADVNNPLRVQALPAHPPEWQGPDWIAALTLAGQASLPLVFDPRTNRFAPGPLSIDWGRLEGFAQPSDLGLEIAHVPLDAESPGASALLETGRDFLRVDVRLGSEANGQGTVRGLAAPVPSVPWLRPRADSPRRFDLPAADPGQPGLLLMSRQRSLSLFESSGVLHLDRPVLHPLAPHQPGEQALIEVPELGGAGIWFQVLFRSAGAAHLSEPRFLPGD